MTNQYTAPRLPEDEKRYQELLRKSHENLAAWCVCVENNVKELAETMEVGKMENIDTWAILELFGHQEIAGRVTEKVIGGQAFVQVNVPAVGEHPTFTKFYSASAIYAITPVDESVVKAYLARNTPQPVNPYRLELSMLAPGGGSPPEREGGEEGDEEF